MRRATDRLAFAKARPLFVEDAVRGALHDAIVWRIGGGAAPNADAFATAAVAFARLALDAIAADSEERSRTLGAVQNAANRFSRSALGRRLLSVPASQLLPSTKTPDGPDAIVRDRRRRLHAIALRLESAALDAGRTATTVANATALSLADRLTPLTVHVLSLATGRRQSFEREVFDASPRVRVA